VSISYVVQNGRRIEVETLDTGPPTKKRQRREGTFVQVPLQWASKALTATNSKKAMVCVYLLYCAWRKKSDTFALPNGALAEFGVSRKIKYRALRQLEAAGLIVIEHRPRRTPIITLIW
jgi:hypothetical protein